MRTCIRESESCLRKIQPAVTNLVVSGPEGVFLCNLVICKLHVGKCPDVNAKLILLAMTIFFNWNFSVVEPQCEHDLTRGNNFSRIGTARACSPMPSANSGVQAQTS